MKKISLKVLTSMAVLTITGLVIAGSASDEGTLNQIAGYRQWTRVSPQPVVIADVGSLAI
jgi:hypothetical protein